MFKKLFPDLYLNNIYEIDFENMRSLGIKAFIFDIDNTLVGYDMPVATEKVAKWIESLAGAGFFVYLVSNNNKERVEAFANSVSVPYYARALKPRRKYLKLVCDTLGLLPKECALVGDQLFTDMYGGNRMKMFTVLVKPIAYDKGLFVKFKRSIENIILKSKECGK